MGDFDEKTTVPVVWVAIAMPFLISGIFWAASGYSAATEARERITVLEARWLDIQQRLQRIEDSLPKHSQGREK